MCSRYLMMRRCGWLSDVERSTPVIGGSVARFRLTVFFAASMQPCSVGNSSTGYPGRRDVIITRGACRCFVYCLGLYRSGTRESITQSGGCEVSLGANGQTD